MQNKSLLKISLTIGITGIFILLILANTKEPIKLKIKEINYIYLDKKIQTQGEITSIRSYKESDFQITTIQDSTGKIDITSEITNIKKNQTIKVIGTIKKYKDNLQIQSDKIDLLNAISN